MISLSYHKRKEKEIRESGKFHLLLQLGGPDGELGAATRYLSQRYSAPWGQVKAGLTDIGTEELAHIEIVSAILYQLTKGLSIDEIKEGGLETYFVDHTTGIYPQAASGMPFSASTLQSTGDIICDLTEDLAAEQKARVTYDNILRLVDDPDVRDPIKFLREREIVHFQRFGEAKRADKSITSPDRNRAIKKAEGIPSAFLLLMKVLPLCGKQSCDIFGQRFGVGEVDKISGGEGDGAAFFGAA